MEIECIDNEVVWRIIISIHGAPLPIASPKFPGVDNRNIAMDNIDLVLIPFIYLLRLTLTILSVEMFLLPSPGNLGKAIRRGALGMEIGTFLRII